MVLQEVDLVLLECGQYAATIDGQNAIGFGQTPKEALGDMLYKHQSTFRIRIEESACMEIQATNEQELWIILKLIAERLENGNTLRIGDLIAVDFLEVMRKLCPKK